MPSGAMAQDCHFWLCIQPCGFTFTFVAPGDRKCTRTELQDLLYHVEEGQLWCLTGLMPLKALRVYQAGTQNSSINSMCQPGWALLNLDPGWKHVTQSRALAPKAPPHQACDWNRA